MLDAEGKRGRGDARALGEGLGGRSARGYIAMVASILPPIPHRERIGYVCAYTRSIVLFVKSSSFGE